MYLNIYNILIDVHSFIIKSDQNFISVYNISGPCNNLIILYKCKTVRYILFNKH